jgi:uncharacterized protein YbjQ (UPF0145 family)
VILSTTSMLDGMPILAFKGLVFGETAVGAGVLKELGAAVRAVVGGASKGFEEKLVEVRQTAIDEMTRRARALGANAIIGVRVDYERFSDLFVTAASGTAVVVQQP